MATIRLTERVAAPFAGSKVNREAGYIDDVLICGTSSLNGRDYPVSVFKRDFAKYEGKPVNCNHSREADVETRLGWFTHVRVGEDGRPRGRFNCLKAHPMYERVMEAAERNPALYGFSHVAMCRTRPGDGGREVVEAIDEVESIDLVRDPATGTTLEGKNVKISLKQFSEKFGPKLGAKRWAALEKLCEDYGAASDTTMVDSPPDDASEGDMMTSLMSALTPLIQEAFETGNSDKACSALKDFVKVHAKHTGQTTDTAQKPDDTATESKKRADVIAECEAAKLTDPPAKLVERLVRMTDKADRTDYIELTKKTLEGQGRETPQSGARPGSKPTTEATVPVDGKAFAESVRT